MCEQGGGPGFSFPTLFFPRPLINHTVSVDVKRIGVPGEIKRREVELDPQVSPEELNNEQGDGAGLRKLDFFRFGLFLNSSAADIVLVTLQLKQQLRGALVAAQWRGDTALTLPSFWTPP